MFDKDIEKKLNDFGLWASPSLECFRGGVWVVKPASVKDGNFIPDYEPCGLVMIDEMNPEGKVQPDSNAPMLVLMPEEDGWSVMHPSVGSLGAGGFTNRWKNVEEALDDIYDYYFGDPKRMKSIELAHYAYRQKPMPKPIKINIDELKELTDAGLFVIESNCEKLTWPNDLVVGLPDTVDGNRLPDYKPELSSKLSIDSIPETSAPIIQLYKTSAFWTVYLEQRTRSVIPGDFAYLFETKEEAIKDVLDYYFGDPKRMNQKLGLKLPLRE